MRWAGYGRVNIFLYRSNVFRMSGLGAASARPAAARYASTWSAIHVTSPPWTKQQNAVFIVAVSVCGSETDGTGEKIFGDVCNGFAHDTFVWTE